MKYDFSEPIRKHVVLLSGCRAAQEESRHACQVWKY